MSIIIMLEIIMLEIRDSAKQPKMHRITQQQRLILSKMSIAPYYVSTVAKMSFMDLSNPKEILYRFN